MTVPTRADVEVQGRRHLSGGDHRRAAELIVRGLGPEIFGWMHAVAPSPDVAEEAFSAFNERLIRALPKFEARSSLRTWAYSVARHVLLDEVRSGSRRRVAPLDSRIEDGLAVPDPTLTADYLKSDFRIAFDRIRASLTEEDRTVLVLRVDRSMSWNDIALVLARDGETIDLKKRAAALRKRFERIKAEIRARARDAGLFYSA